MRIGPGSAVNPAAINRRAQKLEEKTRQVREERIERVRDMESLDNFAPGSRERKAMADVLMSGIDSVNSDAREISREKAELQAMRLAAARQAREENETEASPVTTVTVQTEAGQAEGKPGAADAKGVDGSERGGDGPSASEPAIDPEGPPGQIVDERI